MLEISKIKTDQIRPSKRNARTHTKKQIRQVAESIRRFGFLVPVIVDDNLSVIAGHARLEAAKILGLKEVPAVRASHLNDVEARALALAENRIAQNAGWDRAKLAIEIPELTPLLSAQGLDISVTAFEVAEIDKLIADFEETSGEADAVDGEHLPAISRKGDLWQLGNHSLLCGNARDPADYAALLGDREASMSFCDPPYNVRISDIVGRGRIKHREFSEASGELSSEEFTEFLQVTLHQVALHSRDGSLAYVCMDWKHCGELLAAAKRVFHSHVATCIWTKTNAGQGSFYRSAHEQILVFRKGTEAHLNNVQLGRFGRSRSNVWTYPGANTFRPERLDDLRAHPTVKPTALVADAIKDSTRRGELIIDVFAGSGTTVLAAESVGRVAACMEIDPGYVDVSIRRWERTTGKDAVLAGTGSTFEEVSAARRASENLNTSTVEARHV